MTLLNHTNPIKKLFVFCLIAYTFFGCSNDNEVKCFESVYIGVTDVTGPTTATVNQTITLNVNFEVQSSCGKFEAFSEENTATNEKTIALLARYEGCNCTLNTFSRIQPYTFTPTAAGTYVFKFKITNTTFKTITVIVT